MISRIKRQAGSKAHQLTVALKRKEEIKQREEAAQKKNEVAMNSL